MVADPGRDLRSAEANEREIRGLDRGKAFDKRAHHDTGNQCDDDGI